MAEMEQQGVEVTKDTEVVYEMQMKFRRNYGFGILGAREEEGIIPLQ